MTYKIVFSDIDGTLLNRERELSPLTLRIIRELQKKVPVILISSRMPQAMQHLQEELHISKSPLICYNGAQIIVEGETISSTEIPWKIVNDLYDHNLEVDCHLSLFNDTDWFVPAMDFWAKREQNNTKVVPRVKAGGEVLQEWKIGEKGAHKIMCMGEPQKVDAIEEYLFRNFKNELHLYRSKDTYLEVANKEVSKLSAIKILLDSYFGLTLRESIAFGDNYNDYEMIKAAGLGIAVGNARSEILEVAKQITQDGNQDGVALSLQKLFNLF